MDTREDASDKVLPANAPLVSLMLGHLKSYESMGAAYVQCVSGCACNDSVIEGTWDRRATLMQMHEFKVGVGEGRGLVAQGAIAVWHQGAREALKQAGTAAGLLRREPGWGFEHCRAGKACSAFMSLDGTSLPRPS